MNVNFRNIELIIYDIDGTIINDDKYVSKNLIQKTKELSSDGIKFALASSRPAKSIRNIWREFDLSGHYLAFDGGIIFDKDGNNLQSSPIVVPYDLSFIHNLESLGLTLSIFTEFEWFSTDLGYWAQREIRGTGISPKLKTFTEIINILSDVNNSVFKIMVRGQDNILNEAFEFMLNEKITKSNKIYSGRPTIFEIVSSGADKFLGCSYICKIENISPKNVLYFGDGINDLSCIRNFENSVAMSNSHTEILKQARFITGSNNEDGVFHFINEFFDNIL